MAQALASAAAQIQLADGTCMELSVGIHTGAAHCVVVGVQHPVLTVCGQLPEVAVALQASCPAGCVHVSAEVHTLLGGECGGEGVGSGGCGNVGQCVAVSWGLSTSAPRSTTSLGGECVCGVWGMWGYEECAEMCGWGVGGVQISAEVHTLPSGECGGEGVGSVGVSV